MMAMSKTMPDHRDPGDIEALLPWHAAGTLNARDARRVTEALERDPALAKQYAAILEEYAATIELNESLGAPSSRAMQKLFAAIDAEPARSPQSTARRFGGGFSEFFASLSPKALAWSASVAGLALLLQAGLIGMLLAWPQGSVFQTASYQPQRDVAREPAARSPAPAPMMMAERSAGPVVRSAAPQAGPRAFVKFAPDARAADITKLLDDYNAVVIDSGKGGLFRLQFGDQAMSKQDQEALIGRLQKAPIVALVLPAP
jgi:anti-sigma factor RsiW